ncbi:MAG: HPr kinase/phosphorylase [Sphingomonadales bacterium]
MILEHATCIDLDGAGILLRGPSGSGKSDLALRLIDGGARLLSDDYVSLSARDGLLHATPPESIAGIMEVRGIGLISLPNASSCTVSLVVDLVDREQVPRLPEPEQIEIDGIMVSRIVLDPFEISAAAKIRLAVEATQDRIRRV